jgi:hypothetical protein
MYLKSFNIFIPTVNNTISPTPSSMLVEELITKSSILHQTSSGGDPI